MKLPKWVEEKIDIKALKNLKDISSLLSEGIKKPDIKELDENKNNDK